MKKMIPDPKFEKFSGKICEGYGLVWIWVAVVPLDKERLPNAKANL